MAARKAEPHGHGPILREHLPPERLLPLRELGVAYADSVNTCGLSGQYARYQQGNEWSAELTWRRTLNASVAVQPSLQYIHNPNGSFVALTARLCCTF